MVGAAYALIFSILASVVFPTMSVAVITTVTTEPAVAVPSTRAETDASAPKVSVADAENADAFKPEFMLTQVTVLS